MKTNTVEFAPETARFVQNRFETDYEVGTQVDELNTMNAGNDKPLASNIKYGLLGILFGIVFVKAEIVSWFRIQEMFRLESFHMYGVIGSAVVVGIISVWLIKRFNVRSMEGDKIVTCEKKFSQGQIYGGLIFGLGWGITGACPGPLFAQIGSGALVITITLLSAIVGTWVYGRFREKLPH